MGEGIMGQLGGSELGLGLFIYLILFLKQHHYLLCKIHDKQHGKVNMPTVWCIVYWRHAILRFQHTKFRDTSRNTFYKYKKSISSKESEGEQNIKPPSVFWISRFSQIVPLKHFKYSDGSQHWELISAVWSHELCRISSVLSWLISTFTFRKNGQTG